MTRPAFRQFRKKALKRPAVKAQYDALEPLFAMKRQMIALRQAAGLSQEQMAMKLRTNTSSNSRLESVNSSISPRLSTLTDYARVLGYQVRVEFEPCAR